MTDKYTFFKGGFGAFASFVTFLLGGWDSILQTLIIFIVVDYITGVAAGYVNSQLSSRTGAKGIIKKFLIIAIVVVATHLDRTVSAGELLRNTVVYFFIANEALSILENAGACGLKTPKALLDRLDQLKL